MTFKHHFLRSVSVESQEGNILITWVQKFRTWRWYTDTLQQDARCFCSVCLGLHSSRLVPVKSIVPDTKPFWWESGIKPSFSENGFNCFSRISFLEAGKLSNPCDPLSCVSRAALEQSLCCAVPVGECVCGRLW